MKLQCRSEIPSMMVVSNIIIYIQFYRTDVPRNIDRSHTRYYLRIALLIIFYIHKENQFSFKCFCCWHVMLLGIQTE